MLSSQIEQPVKEEMQDKTNAFQQDNHEFIRNPAVLEFLNIPTNYAHTEQQLEQALIDNLQHSFREAFLEKVG